MADQRHRTILEIGVDDRQLRNAGKTLDSAFSAKAMEAFEKSLERTAALMAKIAESQEKIARGQEKMSRSQGQASAGGLAARLFARAMGTTDRDTVERLARAGLAGDYGMRGRVIGGAYVGGAATASATDRVATTAGRVGGMLMNEGFIGQILGGLPYVGPIFGGAASAAGGYYQAHVARQRARAQAYGTTYLGRAEYEGIPDEFGLGPQGLPQALAEFGRASGLRGGDLTSRFPTAASLANLMGVGYAESGGFMRALRGVGMGGFGRSVVDAGGSEAGRGYTLETGLMPEYARRRRNAEPGGEVMGGLRRLLGAAFEIGVDESDLSRVVSDIGNAVVSMHEQGIMVDPQSMTGLVAAIGGVAGTDTGLAGMAGVRLAQSMTEGLRGVARNPQDDLFQMLAMESAGYGRGATYMEARQRLQESPETLVSDIVGRLQGMVGDTSDPRQREALANLIERVFSSIGVSMSIRQAMSLAGADMTEFRRDFERGPAEGRTEFDRHLADLEREGSPLFGTLREEARYENERARIGEDIAGAYTSLRRTEIGVVGELLPPVINGMRDLVGVVTTLIDTLSREGIGGLFSMLAEMLGNILNPFAGPPTVPGAPAGGAPTLPADTEPRPGRRS